MQIQGIELEFPGDIFSVKQNRVARVIEMQEVAGITALSKFFVIHQAGLASAVSGHEVYAFFTSRGEPL